MRTETDYTREYRRAAEAVGNAAGSAHVLSGPLHLLAKTGLAVAAEVAELRAELHRQHGRSNR